MQDVVNLKEFANGAVTSQWCNVRIQIAHPASFNLIIMGIGNQNWGSQYIARLKIFSNAIKIIIMYKNYLVPTVEPM